jgi:hypothetical protein
MIFKNLLQLETYLNYLVEFYYGMVENIQSPDQVVRAYIDGMIDGVIGLLKAMNPAKYDKLKYSFELNEEKGN